MTQIQPGPASDLVVSGLRGQPTVKRNDELGQAEFLELMTTQLTHQDPLKPMEGGEFLGQLAQFGTVNGIQELQSSIDAMAGSLQSTEALQAANMLGRQAVVPGRTGILPEGGTLNGVVEVPQAVGELSVDILDSGGQLVRHLDLGARSAGAAQLSWDGLMDNGEYAPPGVYQLRAEAAINGTNEAVETLVAATVESVSIGRGGAGLTVHLSGIGATPFSQIREIL